MDPNVDPCDNFYDFACGKFVRETVMPDDKTTITSFSMISDHLKEQLRTIIEEPSQSKEAHPFTLAKDLYKSCMNKSKLKVNGLGEGEGKEGMEEKNDFTSFLPKLTD